MSRSLNDDDRTSIVDAINDVIDMYPRWTDAQIVSHLQARWSQVYTQDVFVASVDYAREYLEMFS